MQSITAMAIGALGAAAICSGCGPGGGTLAISIYGEEFIEDEIPAAEFSDGWAVDYDQFLVSVGQISAADGADAEPGLADASYRIFDMTDPTDGAGHRVMSAEVDGGLYDHLDYHIAPATDAVAGNVDQADVDFMSSGGLSVYVAGTATNGVVTKTFAWEFSKATSYVDCESNADIDGGEAGIEITIHGDHLFYDDLISHEPHLSFDVVAEADADSDGEITAAELAAFDISTQERYQVGSLDIHDLWDYIAYSATTIGHVDGEGHCHIE